MALIDHGESVSKAESSRDATKHPGVCLVGFFAFLVGSALLVHLVFNALF